MGQEIVYCCRCQIRLTGADLERSVRGGNRVACKDCAAEFLASLPPEEQEGRVDRAKKSSGKISIIRGVRPPSTARMNAPRLRPSDPSSGNKNVWIVAAVVGALVLAILLVAVMGRSTPEAVPPETGP